MGSGCSKPSSVGLLRCVCVGCLLEAVLPHTPGENLQINMVLLVGWRNVLPPSCPHEQHKTSENEMRQDCPGKISRFISFSLAALWLFLFHSWLCELQTSHDFQGRKCDLSVPCYHVSSVLSVPLIGFVF